MNQIDHLGIAVKSIEAVRAFYGALGLHITQEETVEHEQVRTAMLPIGESRIELLEPVSPDSTIARVLQKRGPGLHHVALRVDDIAATLASLKAQNIRLVSDEIQTGAGGHLYFFVHPSSTGGVLLEICQNADPESLPDSLPESGE